MYSAKLLEYFQNPRNAGEIDDADATAEIENPACGDILRLSLKIDGGEISQARFKAKGCVASIGCASALSELIAGKTLDDARAIGRNELMDAVGGLPQASTHAAQLAIDALAEALKKAGAR